MSVETELRSIARRIRPALGDGSSFLIGAQGLQTFLRLGSNLIMTRLLSPESYGVVGIITSIFYILELVSDMGISSYVVRHKNANPALLNTVWTIRFIRNIILGGVMFAGADVFANLYNEPSVAFAIRISSFIFILNSLASFSYPLTVRHRGIIKISTLGILQFFVVTGTAIVAAYFLRNYWAVIISMFAQAIFLFATSNFVLRSHKPKFNFSKEHFYDLWSYWRYIIPASLMTIVLTQTNIFVMANFFPIAELGKFTIAATLTGTVAGVTGKYCTQVFYPRFAETHRNHPEKELEVYYGSRRQVVMLFAFGIGGIIGGSELLVKILYNDHYLGAGTYLVILCLPVLAMLSTRIAEHAIVAKGFIKISVIANVLRICWALVAAPLAYLLYGPIAVIVVMSLAEVGLLPYFMYKQSKFGVLNFREELIIPAMAGVGAVIGYSLYRLALYLIAAGHIPNF